MRCLGQVTIDVLPDDALQEIFDRYVDQARKVDDIEPWHTLTVYTFVADGVTLSSDHHVTEISNLSAKLERP